MVIASRKVSSWILAAISRDVLFTGIFSSTHLTPEQFYWEAHTLDFYRASQNAVTAVLANSFKATYSWISKAGDKPYYGRC